MGRLNLYHIKLFIQRSKAGGFLAKHQIKKDTEIRIEQVFAMQIMYVNHTFTCQ